jgi:hypothetical protein
MDNPSPTFHVAVRRVFVPVFSLAVGAQSACSAGAADYKSELFQTLKPIYADSFDQPTLNTEFWEPRQSTTWAVREGVLVGAPSSKEFQEKKKASPDPTHAGINPVIWLKQVPENFVCTFRIRYSGTGYKKGFPLIDVGHHIHTIRFSEKATTIAIRKDVETVNLEKPLFSLNQWHDVAIELKKGKLVLVIDGVRHVLESANVDMAGQHQIDFKGLDGGGCEIDDVRLWEGQ